MCDHFLYNCLWHRQYRSRKKEKIDNFVNTLLFDCDRHSNVVGMNLAIVYEGEILYTTGYGVKNLGKLSVFHFFLLII